MEADYLNMHFSVRDYRAYGIEGYTIPYNLNE